MILQARFVYNSNQEQSCYLIKCVVNRDFVFKECIKLLAYLTETKIEQ